MKTMKLNALNLVPLMRSQPRLAAQIRFVFFAVIAIATIVVFFRSMSKANTPSRLGDYTRTAILRWKPQIEALGQQTNIYEAFNYPNPPIMALILRPIVALPPLAAAACWFLLKVAMAAIMVFWSIRFVRGAGKPLPEIGIAIALSLALQPILGDLAHGNVNLFVAAVVFASLELFRRRWDFSSGIVLALAIACKVTPALFLPYFIWKRAWMAVIGTVLGLGLWLSVVPGNLLGAEYNRVLLNSWYERMVKPFVVDGQVTSEHPNQSIAGVVFRLFTHEPSFIEYGEEGNGPPEAAGFSTIVDIGTPTARILLKAITVGFGLLILVTCRNRTDEPTSIRSGLRVSAEWSLIFLGMLLLSERTWKHHAVTLILPFLVLATAAFTSTSKTLRWTCGISLGLTALLMYGQSVLSENAQDFALVYGMYTLAFLISTAGIVAVLLSKKTDLDQTDVSQAVVSQDGSATGTTAVATA